MINCPVSNHAQLDRRHRLEYIFNTVGFGDVIMSEIHHGDKLLQLTDTGVVLVRGTKTEDHPLITAYIATITQAVTIYCTGMNTDKLPTVLWKKIQRNQPFKNEQPNN